MNPHQNEPAGPRILRALAALGLVLVALGFGAVGACGVYASAASIWSIVTRNGGGDPYGIWVVGLICAVVGLTLAGVAVRTIFSMGRKKPDE